MTSDEIRAAIVLWQAQDPGSEGDQDAALRMANFLRRILENGFLTNRQISILTGSQRKVLGIPEV